MLQVLGRITRLIHTRFLRRAGRGLSDSCDDYQFHNHRYLCVARKRRHCAFYTAALNCTGRMRSCPFLHNEKNEESVPGSNTVRSLEARTESRRLRCELMHNMNSLIEESGRQVVNLIVCCPFLRRTSSRHLAGSSATSTASDVGTVALRSLQPEQPLRRQSPSGTGGLPMLLTVRLGAHIPELLVFPTVSLPQRGGTVRQIKFISFALH